MNQLPPGSLCSDALYPYAKLYRSRPRPPGTRARPAPTASPRPPRPWRRLPQPCIACSSIRPAVVPLSFLQERRKPLLQGHVPPGIRGATSPTSPHCARWRRAWSISTSASIASQIGVARMPTQGSWRPVVTISTALLSTSTPSTGNRRLEVGLNATEHTTCWPLDIPPRMPPAWLERNPSGAIASRCSLPLEATEANPSPISTPLTALIDIIAAASSASSLPYTGSPQERKSTRLNSSH